MEATPHQERTLSRIGSPVAASVLAVLVFVVMVVQAPRTVQIATLAVAVVLQVGLMAGRALSLRRASRPADFTLRWHQFAFLWSIWSGAMHLLEDEGSPASALIMIVMGFLFALFMVAALRFLEARLRRQQRGTADEHEADQHGPDPRSRPA